MTPAGSRLISASRTDPGLVRSNNEDALAEDLDIGLLVLADGMGGYNAGEVAAGIATATIVDLVRKGWSEVHHGKTDFATGLWQESLLLKHAIEQAHRSIFHIAQSQADCAGMGTTVVACLSHEAGLSVAHVGDSRLYRYGAKGLEPMTRDHSLLEEMVARGYYEREEAVRIVRKNIVTRALGVETDVEVEVREDRLAPGDVLLLCSDGLTDMVPESLIESCLAQHGERLDAAASALVAEALAAGGRDNVSVLLARSTTPARVGGHAWIEKIRQWI